MKSILTLVAAASWLVVAPAQAQIAAQTQAPAQTPGAPAAAVQGQGTATRAVVNDALFAAAAAESGLAELTLSQLGVQKATDPELKRFSQQMIEDHTRMDAELKSLAARKGLALPQAVGYRSAFCSQSLAGLSGEEFDRCYAKAQLVAHMEAVGLFESEAQRGQDRDIMALASKGLPHIKEHLKMIKPIAKKYMKEDESESHRAATTSERPVR